MPVPAAILFGSRLDPLSWEQALTRICHWAAARSSRMVCLCNVHTVMTARRDLQLHVALQSSDMNTADGAPLAWLLRRRGWPEQQRINGPDLMWRTLEKAERLGLSVYLYGSTETTLLSLHASLRRAFPKLRIAGVHAPPFRPLNDEEDEIITSMINLSGAQIVMVGLGCPKQEQWMAAHRGRISAVMLGVGAAFDYHAGHLRRAPLLWQRAGMEWLYRLAMEPSRLLRRYLVTNTQFLLALPAELWRRPRR